MGCHSKGLFLKCRTKRFNLSTRPLIMGILNITTDSFSDGSPQALNPSDALRRAKAMIAAGADILDVGAESTRPGAEPVSEQVELQRLLPILKRIVPLGVPISVDTYKPEVARKSIAAGVQLVNDVTGLRNPEMRNVVARTKVPVIIMHMQGMPRVMQKSPIYSNVVQEVRRELVKQARLAQAAGIAASKIILDPGIGFGKKLEHNLLLLNNIKHLINAGYPVLIGSSRKSFIADILGAIPPQERLWGTAASISMAVSQGAHILRVHDVAEMKMVVQVTQAIKQAGKKQSSLTGRRPRANAV